MSITRGHLPKLIICLFLNSVLPACAQSAGEQLPGALPDRILSLNAMNLPTDTFKTPGRTTSMLAGRRSTAGSVATNIIDRTDTLVPEKTRREIAS